MIQAAARSAYSKTVLIQQLSDASYKEYFVMLIIAPVSAPLNRLELGKFLLPITQHVRLHPAQIAYLTDSKVAFCGNQGQR